MIKFSHPQCLGLWALASELPMSCRFEVVDAQDGYGSIYVNAIPTDDTAFMPTPRLYKLHASGGRLQLESSAPIKEEVETDGETVQ